MDGIVTVYSSKVRKGLVTGTDGIEYYFHQRFVIPEEQAGRRSIYEGDVVTFDPIYESDADRKVTVREGKPAAINVKPLLREPQEPNPDYYEECLILSADGVNGILLRPDGDTILFHVKNVITFGPVAPGRRVIARFVKTGAVWLAEGIEIILEEGEVFSGTN